MKQVFFGILTAIILGGGFLAIKEGNLSFKRNSKDDKLISPISQDLKLDVLGERNTKRKEERNIVYGYLPYWTVQETENFDLKTLTDIAYFGLYIDEEGNFIKTQTNDEGESLGNPGYNTWHNNEKLKTFIQKAKNAKVDISLTIISHVDDTSTKFLNCGEDCWKNFYENLKAEMKVHNVEDVNLNFEYYETVDKEIALKYSDFALYVKKELNKDYENPELVVTTFADSLINNRVSDVESLAKIADKLFIMGYDFHVTPSDKASPVSPMGGNGVHAGYDVRTMLKDYLSYAPPQKLILGVPYYGFDWGKGEEIEITEAESQDEKKDEKDTEENGEDSESAEENDSKEQKENVKIIRDSSTIAYADIIKHIEETGAKVQWDELGQVPYYEYQDEDEEKTRKVYFENAKSLKVKYEIAKEYELAGVGIWALGYDADRPELWQLLEQEF